MEIQDFGEKIGGAKKDLWKERGLSVEDLPFMNEAERSKLIKKDNIWKKPNYQEMVEQGLSTRVAYFIKMLRDATPTKPLFSYFDRDIEKIQEKQEQYIEFVKDLRDYAMKLSSQDEILTFYDDFLCKYVNFENSYSVEILPNAISSIDNKLLNLTRIKNFRNIDYEIKRKQFCYTEDEKILSNFDCYVYDNDNIRVLKDSNDRTVIEIKVAFGKKFLYPKEPFDNPDNWIENTIFITAKGGNIVEYNLKSIDSAEQFILNKYKKKTNITKQTRKGKFVPKQLQHITRTGEDYRNGNDITGEDMMNTFNFRGGEFGNWLNENDRQESLNYGYDALLDLSKALSILPTDISLNNRLSIAFGSRGSGSALAHYESDREVINLTKMKGAGSLAHEWAHALDDISGKELGYKGFLTENYRLSDSILEIMKSIINTMQYKTVSNDEITEKQQKKYDTELNKIKIRVNTFFPPEHLSKEQIIKKDKLIENLIKNSEQSSKTLMEYLITGVGNKDIDDLSNLRKQTVGRVISKEDRKQIAHLQSLIYSCKSKIGSPEQIKTDFYQNSIIFDNLYASEKNGYWKSPVEMFARAFACYVTDKLSNRSDYLCGHSDLALGFVTDKNNELQLIKAFPEGEERQTINKQLDKLIDFLKEKNILHDYNINKSNDNFDLDYEY